MKAKVQDKKKDSTQVKQHVNMADVYRAHRKYSDPAEIDEDRRERFRLKFANRFPVILFAIILFATSCTKTAEVVRLQLTPESNRLFYSFTYQGAGYTPTDSTHIEMRGYRFTLPANEASGYMIPAGYDSADSRARVIDNPAIKIVQIY